jgi:putative restriction endonuclease
MFGLIAVTDREWFECLRRLRPLDEANFWRPSDTRTPRQLGPGTPVLFKLRRRFGSWIVGWGTFARHDVLLAWLAWDVFEQRNGAESFSAMRRRIERLRPDHGGRAATSGDYEIGCLMLSQPAFLDEGSWVKPPDDWPENAVQGKRYDLLSGEGARVWRECLARRNPGQMVGEATGIPQYTAERYGEPVLVSPRLGQGIFRLAVTGAYGRACAVTGEHSLPALDAAHIQPFGEGGVHEVSNGLLLRSDIHKLFDKGYVGVTPDHRFVVSKRLKDEFANGRSYYPLHGEEIRLPKRAEEQPSSKWLEWHMDERFRR